MGRTSVCYLCTKPLLMGTKLNEEYILAEVLSTPNNALRTSKGKSTNPFGHLLERERETQ